MSKKISKIAAFHNGHDVAYCILENGIPILHNELERFIRVKEPHSDGVPFLVDTYKDLEDIDLFVDSDYERKIDPAINGKSELSYQEHNYKDGWDIINKKPNLIIGHHQSHAASAFYSSNFDEALIITMDGGGGSQYYENGELVQPTYGSNSFPYSAFTIWKGEGNKITPILMLPADYLNIGSMWSHLTKELGLCGGYCHYQTYADWKKNPDPKGWFGHAAGTVMAMATIGKPNEVLVENFKQHAAPVVFGNPIKTLDLSFISFNDREHQNDKEVFDHKCMLAASLQKATEEIIFEVISKYLQMYPIKNICLSGGVALNAVAAGKMYDKLDIDNIHVDPVPGDNGLPLGAALYTWYHILDNPRIKWHDNLMSYLGKTYDKKEIEESFTKFEDKITISNVTDDDVINLLTDEKIVAVFGGGSESGRRALGNRSILADPSSPNMKDLINSKVKHRQWFRPFAPSILREDVTNWFDHDIDSPYMSFVIKFKDSVKHKVPAVVHFDGSARIQTVTEKDNNWYYRFIGKFKQKTGIPMLLNTSFNDREPIVETPYDAIKCFLGTDIDYLYFYDFNILIKKNNNI